MPPAAMSARYCSSGSNWTGAERLFIDGVLQSQDGVISVRAQRVEPLTSTRAALASHDFHLADRAEKPPCYTEGAEVSPAEVNSE